jgi:hypothetical protein
LSMVGGLAPSMPALGFTDPAGALANATTASSFRCGLSTFGPAQFALAGPDSSGKVVSFYQLVGESLQVTRSARLRNPLSALPQPLVAAANADPPRLFGWRSLGRLASTSDVPCRAGRHGRAAPVPHSAARPFDRSRRVRFDCCSRSGTSVIVLGGRYTEVWRFEAVRQVVHARRKAPRTVSPDLICDVPSMTPRLRSD